MSSQSTSQRKLVGPQEKPAANPFDPWLIWVAFRRHWAWAIPVGLGLASISALVVWYQFVPEFQATHWLEANRDYVLVKDTVVPSNLVGNERPLITNQLVLDSVLADPALKAAPSLANSLTAENEIRRRIGVGNAGAENLLTISYRDSDPVFAAKICNAVVGSYLQVRRRFDDNRIGNVEQWLMQPIEQWKRNVENLRNKLAELSNVSNGVDPFKQFSPIISNGATKLVEYRVRLAELEAAEIEITAREKVLESRADVELTGIDPMRLKAYVDADRTVAKVRVKLHDVESKVRMIESREQENILASRYKELQAEMVTVNEELTKAESAARQVGLTSLANSTHAELQFQRVNLQARREIYTKEYEDEKTRLESLGGETADMFFAREEYERASAILDQLNNRLAMLRTERGRGASIQSMAEAKTPTLPIEEVPSKKILMMGGAAFMIPFALALLFEFWTARITSANSVEVNRLKPVMGEIARIPSGAKRRKGHRLFEESIDSLRANLLFKLQEVRTIVVTSAMPAEGKSSVAAQLAVSLAKYCGEGVLIIDADVRSPDLHEHLGLELGPGLCKLLNGRATLDECINKSLGDALHVIPAGRLDSNPHNLLTKKNLALLFEQLAGKYRYIVIDTAPVLPAAESLVVAASCDATLLCAMRDVSRLDHSRRALRRLEESGADVIGTVFSGVPPREYEYRYGDYRYAASGDTHEIR